MTVRKAVKDYKSAFKQVWDERGGKIHPKVLISDRDFPIHTLGHAIDNIKSWPVAPIVVIIPNFDSEGQSLFCTISNTEIYPDREWQSYAQAHGKPTSFYEIPADSLI